MYRVFPENFDTPLKTKIDGGVKWLWLKGDVILTTKGLLFYLSGDITPKCPPHNQQVCPFCQ